MQETLDSRKKLIDELEARNKALNEQYDQSQSDCATPRRAWAMRTNR